MTTRSYLRITDGTETINFSFGDELKLITYNPQLSLGGEMVSESADVDFVGTIRGNIENYNRINRMFEQARNYARSENGPRVYIEFDPGSRGFYSRSELTGGRILLNDDVIGWQWDIRLRLRIEWTRQPFWEGPLTQLRLTNTSATNDLAGIEILNVNDGSGENFAAINAQDVEGDLPAPVKVEMYDASDVDPKDEIYIFHNVYSNPASFTHILEGEDATGATVTSTVEGAIACSDDNYAAISWTATTETKIATWAISSAQLSYAAGGRFAIVARWRDAFPYSDMWLRVKLESSAGTVDETTLTLIPDLREMHFLGSLELPPNGAGLSDLAGLNLVLYGLREQAGAHTINLDYLMLGPISNVDGWKHFVGADSAVGVDYQEYFYHDDTEGFDYRVDTSGDKVFEFTSYGGPIALVPNKDQYLYFLSCDSSGNALVTQDWTVKLWYRPRRNAL